MDSSNSEGLQGAKFELTYGQDKTSEATSDKDGFVKFTDVPVAAGQSYSVKETAAPSGYQLKAGEISLTLDDLVLDEDGVDADKSSTKYKLGSINSKNWDLDDDGYFRYKKEIENTSLTVPSTGGVGTWMFTLGGAALIVLAGAMFIILKKKNTSK